LIESTRECHFREAACGAIVKITDIRVFVILGLTRNPVHFGLFTLLDAGSVIPDLIRDWHDGQKIEACYF
jgi:hypothetical protein